jgi:hypothetical protein
MQEAYSLERLHTRLFEDSAEEISVILHWQITPEQFMTKYWAIPNRVIWAYIDMSYDQME